MKKFLLILCIFSFPFYFYGQGEANNWFFGENAGLNFDTGTVTPITGSLSTLEGCSSFSDKDGNLLFYSDGTTVWDKNHDAMPSGDGTLKGNSSSTQSAIIVPHPGDDDIYYIFTVGAFDSETSLRLDGFQSYTVNMSLNSGLGDIEGSAVDLSNGYNSTWTEKVTAVKGEDCNTYWVISLVGSTYYSYKIDDSGLNTTPVISNVNYISDDYRGYLKISPDGTKLASATFTQYTDNSTGLNVIGDGKLHLYSFNDVTGVVSNDGIELISDALTDGAPYGVEFSPSSSKIYTSTYNGYSNKLYQFDLDATDIPNSKILIKSQTGYRGGLQLGPNGKIYATVPVSYTIGTGYLDVINEPNNDGTDCNYETDGLYLNGATSMQGLPPFISSILLPIEITDGTTDTNLTNTITKKCIGGNFTLQPENIEGTPSYSWTFGGNIISTDEQLVLTNLTYADEGTYYFEAETIDDCGYSLTYSGEVEIQLYDPPTITKPSDILQCDDDNDGFYSFDLATLRDAEVLNGQDNTTFEVLYFTSQDDANDNTNPITGNYTNSSAFSTDTLYARIHNIENTSCYEIESFTIQVFETYIAPTSIDNYSVCDTNTTGTDTDGVEEFDLTIKETEILNGINAANFSITYYSDAAFSIEITNPSTYQNATANNQTIYVWVENILNSTCNGGTTFEIEVFELPTINSYFEFKQCDEDGVTDGFTDFNLDEANDYITNSDSTVTVTYFETEADAENNSNTITSSPHNNSYLSTVYARVENTNGCYRVAQLDLLVSTTSIADDYLLIDTACDDDDTADGLRAFDLSVYSSEIMDLFPTGQNLTVSYFRNLSDAQLEENEIPTSTPFLTEEPYQQTLYVRVESEDNGECFGLGPHLQLNVQSRPEFEIPETAIYCQNLDNVEVSVSEPINTAYTYEWFDSSGNSVSTNSNAFIESAGDYTVIATSSAGCESFPQTITIEPSIIASISEDDITIVDDSENNTITIDTTNLGIGDYEFSLDDSDYQDDPYFDNVEPGIKTIYIRDKNNCGTAEITVSIIYYPKFFTPNNDGYNDTWQIIGVSEDFYATSNIYIFDRFGKLIAEIDPTGDGWDGLYKGKMLTSTDYWFSIELIDDNGNSKVRKGHFSLIRN